MNFKPKELLHLIERVFQTLSILNRDSSLIQELVNDGGETSAPGSKLAVWAGSRSWRHVRLLTRKHQSRHSNDLGSAGKAVRRMAAPSPNRTLRKVLPPPFATRAFGRIQFKVLVIHPVRNGFRHAGKRHQSNWVALLIRLVLTKWQCRA
jgi:hypothetical protein